MAEYTITALLCSSNHLLVAEIVIQSNGKNFKEAREEEGGE